MEERRNLEAHRHAEISIPREREAYTLHVGMVCGQSKETIYSANNSHGRIYKMILYNITPLSSSSQLYKVPNSTSPHNF